MVSTLTSTLQHYNSAYKIHSSNSQTKFLLYDSLIKGMRNSCHYTSTISTALFTPNSSSVFHPFQHCKCLGQHLKNNHSKTTYYFVIILSYNEICLISYAGNKSQLSLFQWHILATRKRFDLPSSSQDS